MADRSSSASGILPSSLAAFNIAVETFTSAGIAKHVHFRSQKLDSLLTKKALLAFAACGVMAVAVYLCCDKLPWTGRTGKRHSRENGDGSVRDGGGGTGKLSDDSDSNRGSLSENRSLLESFSKTISVTTPKFTYPRVRVLYREHPKAAQLPKVVPLVVFIHGLGGQTMQFQHMIEYFAETAHILAVDFPGCGESDFSPQDYNAFTTESLAAIISTILLQYRQETQPVVVIGHSMGCSVAVKLLNSSGLLRDYCSAFVAICPKAVVSEEEQKVMSTISNTWSVLTDIGRFFDRIGGPHSKSVNRCVGKNAPEKVRKMQLQINKQSNTRVLQRMIKGMSQPTSSEWISIRCPIFLIGAEEDHLCNASDVQTILGWFPETRSQGSSHASYIASPHDSTESYICNCVRNSIIPDAGHVVLYEAPQVLLGVVARFFKRHVSEILDPAWQLKYFNNPQDKWQMKNLRKWKSTQCVSKRIEGFASGKLVRTPFRVMKTLRQNDPDHNPVRFGQENMEVFDVVDFSSEEPPYDPTTFGDHVNYHKCRSVSKNPPTHDDVQKFISLVDSIRAERGNDDSKVIACHCHYGFNRSGYFIVSYMVERLGFSVEEAIEAFQKMRPPGIRHSHFITALHERNCLNLQRSSTA